MRAMILAAALLAVAPAIVHAQTAPATAVAVQPSPRETVAAIAARIRDLYFDPVVGDQIADALETEAAAGAFDALTDQRDLAATLSRRLRPLDAHFNVAWDPNAPAGPAPAIRRPPPPGAAPAGGDTVRRLARPANPGEMRGNFGFRKVEILPGNVGYIDLRQFSNIDFDNPADPARRAADSALSFVADADAVIFDLRDNGGGAPSMVGYLTSAFTPADAPIYNVFHSRQGSTSEAPAVFHPNPRLEVPVYVLISGRTGSAGEAASLQTRTPRWAPLASALRSDGSASCGPMVTATTSPSPRRSTICSAASIAVSSNSFN